jgi:hypothetical protein
MRSTMGTGGRAWAFLYLLLGCRVGRGFIWVIRTFTPCYGLENSHVTQLAQAGQLIPWVERVQATGWRAL